MVNEIDIWMGGFDDGRTPSVQQYDVNSRKYLCHLWRRKGEMYCMADDAIVGVVFGWRGVKASNEYETEKLDNSTVLVNVPAEAMQKAGAVKMQLLIHQNGGVLHGPEIYFQALESMMPSDEETDEPALLLVALVDDAAEAIRNADDAANSANAQAANAMAAAQETNEVIQRAERAAQGADAAALAALQGEQKAHASAVLANEAAQTAMNEAQGAANAAEQANSAAGEALIAAGTAVDMAQNAYAAAEQADGAAGNANGAANIAREAAERIENLSVEVEMLSPMENASAEVRQTEIGKEVLLKIPRSNVAYATFDVDDDMHLIMHNPEAFSGIHFALNSNGELEVEI